MASEDRAAPDQGGEPLACVADFIAAAARDATFPDSPEISDADLARALTAGVRLYAARAEATDAFPPPLIVQEATATDVMTAVCEMLRVVDVNMFDLSMWFGRRSV